MSYFFKYLLIFLVLITCNFAFSQKGALTIEGKVLNKQKFNSKATVELYEYGSLSSSKTLSASKRFEFKLNFDSKYYIKIINEDFFTYIIEVNTKVPQEKNNKWFFYDLNINLINKIESLNDNEIFKQPQIIVLFDENADGFDSKKKHFEWIQKQINELVEKEKLLNERKEILAFENKKRTISAKPIDTIKYIAQNKKPISTKETIVNENKNDLKPIVNEIGENMAETNISQSLAKAVEKEEFDKLKAISSSEMIKELQLNNSKTTESENKKEELNKIRQNNINTNISNKSAFMDYVYSLSKKSDNTKIPNNFTPKKTVSPIINEKIEKEMFKTTIKTTIKTTSKNISFTKIEYFFGNTYYYINNQQLEKDDYNHELSKYIK